MIRGDVVNRYGYRSTGLGEMRFGEIIRGEIGTRRNGGFHLVSDCDVVVILQVVVKYGQ